MKTGFVLIDVDRDVVYMTEIKGVIVKYFPGVFSELSSILFI